MLSNKYWIGTQPKPADRFVASANIEKYFIKQYWDNLNILI